MGQFVKGHAFIGGRKKGVPNKDTAYLRAMVLDALDAVGGMDYLIEQARLNPVAFISLIAKLLPVAVTGDVQVKMALSWMTEAEAKTRGWI